MTKTAFQPDEIGYWSEIKLDIVRKYATAYSTIMARQPSIKRHIYIDAFAGAGQHISKTTGDFVPGSPLNALQVTPPFKELHLIDLDGKKVGELRKLTAGDKRVMVHEGDCNDVLLRDVFPRCLYLRYHRALCLLDPYKLNVKWDVLRTAGQMESIEVFYNFMIMDANMNMFRYVPDPIPMRNSKGATIYYLFFASQNKTGESIVRSIFKAYRNKGAS